MSRLNVDDATKSANGSKPSPDPERPHKALTELLEAGKFSQYHFEKAKSALAAGDFAVAQYQVAASLSHDRTAEATTLKAEIKRLSRAGR